MIVARLRMFLALGMVAGVFVLAALVLGGMVAAMVWGVLTGTPVGALLGALFASVSFVLIMAMVRLARATPHVPSGMSVSVMAEPELWALVREAADGVGTRTPEEVRLVADANAGVVEDSRWLGFAPGMRVVYIGVPLLQTMTVSELRWVLGHEMGHYSERHTSMSLVTRRALVVLTEIADAFGSRQGGPAGLRPLGWLFRGYLVVYARVVHAVWRRQELDADRWAAALAGSDVGVSALRAIATTGASWGIYARDYASLGTSVGMMPQGIFSGYATFLSDPGRQDFDADRLIAEERRTPLDTHPPTSRRIERLGEWDDAGTGGRQVSLDERPAMTVLGDPSRTIGDVEAHLARTLSLTPVPWERAVQSGNRRRDEEKALAVMSVVDALTTGAADLSVALDLIARGGGRQLADALAGGGPLSDAEARDVTQSALQVLVRAALAGAGHVTYVLRWDRADVIVDEAGVEVDVEGLVAQVPGNPATAEWLLEVLRAEGISRTWNPGLSSRVLGPSGPAVQAVLVMSQSWWRWSTPVLYVTDGGLGIRTLGYREYLSIPPLSPQKTPRQLLEHSARFSGLDLLRDHATTLVPWDEMEHVTYVDGARPRLTIKHRNSGAKSYRAVAVAGDVLDLLASYNYGRMSLG